MCASRLYPTITVHNPGTAEDVLQTPAGLHQVPFFNFCVDHSFLPPKFILVYPIFTANCEVLADTV